MNWADGIIIGILLISGLISLTRGLVKEALSLANWGLAFVVAMAFRVQLAESLQDSLANPATRAIAAFVILFLLSFFVGSLIIRLISEIIKNSPLSSVNRLLGMLFGLGRGWVIVMAFIVIVPQLFPIEREDWWRKSALIPILSEYDGRAWRFAREFWRNSDDFVR